MSFTNIENEIEMWGMARGIIQHATIESMTVVLEGQHAAIERKDALLKRALEALKISAVASKTQREVIDTITKELQ